MLDRKTYVSIWNELAREKSMVFLAGPRQSGKTTFAKMVAEEYTNNLYFNWDVITDRRRLMEDPYFFQSIVRKDESKPLVIFDEIHKYKEWKNYLKGAYDRFHDDFQFLITGSGRLDLYQRGGDSLAGRYYAFHLWPLTLGELCSNANTFDVFVREPTKTSEKQAEAAQAIWNLLIEHSGFPDPYTANRLTTYRRWSTTYHRQLIREDIRDLTGVKYIDEIELLFALLPSRIGSPLSIPSLSGELGVSYNTVKNWLAIFERFYLTFNLTPWAEKIARAIHKERKCYLFDYGGIEDPAARFENMVAVE